MKKLFALALSLAVLGAFTTPARADDATPEKKHPKITEEQRKLRKELLEKYDTNKDGKLDKDERAKISKEDKEKLKEARAANRNKKSKNEDKSEPAK